METKNCNKCNTEYKLSGYRKYKNGNFSSECKRCLNEYDKNRKKEKRKIINETSFFECSTCKISKPLKEFTKLKKYYKKKICTSCYPSFLTRQKTEWCSKEHNRNPNYRIKKSLAARLRTVMKKNSSTMNYIGCNIQFLRDWFSYNFTPEMNWTNYGSYWSIDHVIPVSHFNLENEDEKYKCWNWSNLVPLETSKNSSKKNILNDEQVQHVKEKLIKFKEEGSTTKRFSGEEFLHLKI